MSRLGVLHRAESDQAPPARQGQHGTRWVSLGIMAVVVAVGIAALVYILWPTPEPVSNNGVLTYNAPAATDTAAVADGPCNFPTASSTDVSKIVPDDVTWALTPGTTMAAPRSASAGPLHVDGGVSSCYARTPSGALLATANLVAELANTSVDMNDLIAAKVTHTTGYDQLNARTQAWVAQQSRAAEQPIRQITGYRFNTFDASTATLEIVQRNTSGVSTGVMASIYYVMRWDGDDWKLVPPIDGGDMFSMQVAALVSPYVAWAGA